VLRRSQRAFSSDGTRAVDLPGRYYLQAIKELFKTNRFAKGEFIGLGENCR
jgi:poly-beta-hydroxyalkanoate depolymerase